MSKLKELRLKAGLSQKEVAEILNIRQNTLSYHETGVSLLNANQIKTLAVLYGVTSDELLELNNEEHFKQIQKELANRLLK